MSVSRSKERNGDTHTHCVPDTLGAQSDTLSQRSKTIIEPPPSVATMKLSKAQYIELCDRFRDKAQQEHQDARLWRNRAILAESRLATARAAYEPPRTLTPESE